MSKRQNTTFYKHIHLYRHDQMVILYYEIHSFRIIDVPGSNDLLPTSQSELSSPSTGCLLPSRLSST